MFAAQANVCDMEKIGQEGETNQISRNFSEVVSELSNKSVKKLWDLRNSENDEAHFPSKLYRA